MIESIAGENKNEKEEVIMHSAVVVKRMHKTENILAMNNKGR